MSSIHPTAVVSAEAVLAEGVEIGAHAVVQGRVRLGEGCVVHPHATVLGTTSIGPGTVVFPGAVVGAAPQDLKYAGEDVSLVIGARNQIREHVTIHAGTAQGGGVTTLGDDNLLMVGCHVAHDCVVGNGVVLANNVLLAGHIHVQDGAILNGAAACHHFTTIGRLAYVGGLTRITWDVPPFSTVEGHPAKVRAANVVGMRRAGFSDEDATLIRRLIRDVYISSRVTAAEALRRARENHPGHPLVEELLAFVAAAGAGRQGRALEAARS